MYGQVARTGRTLLTRNQANSVRYYGNSFDKRKKKPLPRRPVPQDFELPRIVHGVDSLVKNKSQPPAGWKHGPRMRADQDLLSSSITTKKNLPRPFSLDKIAFTSGEPRFSEDGDAGENVNMVLEPGCFVEVRRRNVATNGVILGEEYVDRQVQYIAMTSTGEVWAHTKDDVLFHVPGLMSRDIVLRCGTGEIATSQHEHAARVEVLKRLRLIQKATEDANNAISSRKLDVYAMVRDPDPTKWGSTTVSEIARLLIQRPTLSHIFAAHKYLISNTANFVLSHDYTSSQRFDVRPLVDVQRMATVGRWTQTNDRRIDEFVAKAKNVMETNRNLPRDGPPTRHPANHQWNADDKEIITYLVQSLRPAFTAQPDPWIISVNHIMRQLTPTQDIFDEVVHQVLIDIGVLAPWQDLAEIRESLNLDLDGSRAAKGEALVLNAYSSRVPAGQPLGPEDFYPSDPVEHVRHDFGNLPVYIIDDAHAEELDDGISVETIPSEPDNVWVHVHVADPTSVLPPGHVLARHASKMIQSMYLYQRTYPMLPKALTHSPSTGMSLGASQGKPQPVLTASMKVNCASGDIVDYQVRAGIVKNLVVTSYESVDKALGIIKHQFSYPFGHSPVEPTKAALNDTQINDIRIMQRVADATNARRYRDGVFNLNSAHAQLYDIKWPSFRTLPTTEPYSFSGFPAMNYRVSYVHDMDSGARNIVAEAMKLAARCISMFLRDRGAPAVRRYSQRPLLASGSALQAVLDARTPNGYVQAKDLHPHLVTETVAGYSTELREHFGLGISAAEGYVRGTSPLRRYGDLIAHWQIKNLLLDKKPLFDEEYLQNFAVELQAKERFLKRAQGQHEAFWHVYFIMRWNEQVKAGLHADKPNPLDRLIAQTTSITNLNRDRRVWLAEATLGTLGVKTIVADLDTPEIPVGSTFPVELSAFRLGVRPQIQVVMKK